MAASRTGVSERPMRACVCCILPAATNPMSFCFHSGEDAEEWRGEVQGLLPWSEGYTAESVDGVTRLRFVDAVEELD